MRAEAGQGEFDSIATYVYAPTLRSHPGLTGWLTDSLSTGALTYQRYSKAYTVQYVLRTRGPVGKRKESKARQGVYSSCEHTFMLTVEPLLHSSLLSGHHRRSCSLGLNFEAPERTVHRDLVFICKICALRICSLSCRKKHAAVLICRSKLPGAVGTTRPPLA